MISLSRRLTLSLAVSLALFFALQALMVVVQVHMLSKDTVISRMQHDAEDLLAALDTRSPILAIDWSHLPSIYTRPLSGHYFQFRRQKESLRSRSLWDEVLPVLKEGENQEMATPDGQQLLLLGKQYSIHGQAISLTIAEDISQLEKTSDIFLERLLLASFAALLALLAMQVWFIRKGLAPLNKLKDELLLLESGNIESLQQPVPAEIEPLVAETNRLLAAMQQRLERSRHAIGNLAHALKTPLTVVTQILERDPGKQDRLELSEQVGLIRNRIQRELARARMAGQSPGGFWRNPVSDIDDLVSTMRRIHQKAIRCDIALAPDTVLHADREDMMELFGNLLDNACKWASSEVRLQVSHHPLTMTVEDDGPGMDAPTRDMALQRGVRADESKSGHGLGLAIVSDLIASYGGTLDMGDSSDLGGLKVIATLPADASP